MITGRSSIGGTGIATAALAFGGVTSNVGVTNTEAFNDTIIFGGNFTSYSGSTANRFVQANCLDGSIPTGSNYNIGTGFNDVVNSIAVQYDNNILVTGNFTSYSGSSINRLARLNVSGGLDTAFSASIGTGLNNTGSVVCIYPNALEAWSARTVMITARNSLGGAGTQNAALAFGGTTAPSPAGNSCTEAYNGSAWSAGGAMIVAKWRVGGTGTQNAALAIGGYAAFPLKSTCTEAYNGSTWAVGGALITARVQTGTAGTQNAALAIGGNGNAAPNALSCTEAYNGTSWSAGGALINARSFLGGAGTQNAALGFGGQGASPTFTVVAFTEAYNGTSWTAGGAMITARAGFAYAGVQTSALAAGGFSTPNLTCTEAYNGSAWSSKNAMINIRNNLAGAGTQNAALAFGGFNSPTSLSCTEAFNCNQILVGGTFTAHSGSTYSGSVRMNISGTLDTSYVIGSGFGNTTAINDYVFTRPTLQSGGPILVGGGFTFYSSSLLFPQPSRIALLNSDGTISGSKATSPIIWTKLAEYTEATSGSLSGSTIAMFYGQATASIVSSSIAFQVLTSSPVTAKAVTGWTYTTNYKTFAYTGSFSSSVNSNPPPMSLSGALNLPGSYILARGIAFKGPGTCTFNITPGTWTAGGAMITARVVLAGAGTQTSALGFGGSTPTVVACTEAYNGSTWTAGGALITARNYLAGAGTQNAALAFGGQSPTNVACTETYNGSTWSAGGAMIVARTALAGIGIQNAALAFGGAGAAPTFTSCACTETYNGSTWSVGGALSTARYGLGGAGTTTAGLAFGGLTPSVVSCTEAYNGSTWSTNNTLITARFYLAGAGTQNATLGFGGASPTVLSCTEIFNGVSWRTATAMITTRCALAGAGTQTAALGFSGGNPTAVACTEVYNAPFTPFTGSGTTGGTDFSNMSVAGEFIITGSDAISNPIYSGSLSNSSIYYAIYEQAGKTYYILLD
jgi:hypothetical protein